MNGVINHQNYNFNNFKLGNVDALKTKSTIQFGNIGNHVYVKRVSITSMSKFKNNKNDTIIAFYPWRKGALLYAGQQTLAPLVQAWCCQDPQL